MGPASAYNMIGTGGAGGLTNGTNGNLVGVTSPDLATTLANNGGPTQTIALLFGSPAIDAGSNALAVDANGNPLVYRSARCRATRESSTAPSISGRSSERRHDDDPHIVVEPRGFGQTVTFTATVAAAYASTNVTHRHRDILERHERAGNGAARQRHGNFHDQRAAGRVPTSSPRFTAAIPTSPTARRPRCRRPSVQASTDRATTTPSVATSTYPPPRRSCSVDRSRSSTATVTHKVTR